jgi:hypothetical protein
MKTERPAWLAVAAIAAAAGVMGPSHGAPPARSTAAHTPLAASSASRSTAPPIRCGEVNPVIGYLGVARPGTAALARRSLGQGLVAQVDDTASGVVDLIRPPASFWYPNRSDNAVGLSLGEHSQLSTRWLPVRALPRQANLRSCYYLMTNRPAAQPLIRAAIAAVVHHGYAASTARLTAELQVVLISDNPAAANSVIVTLMIPGRAYRPIARGAPILHRMAAYTVIMTDPGRQVTGVADGGF